MSALKKPTRYTGKTVPLFAQISELKEKLSAENANLSDFIFGNTPPSAVNLEEAVIGACLLDREAFGICVQNVQLKASDFYRLAHEAIFDAMHTLKERNAPIDLLTVSQFFIDAKREDEIGGVYHLVELTDRVGSAANVEYHSRIIKEKAFARELIAVCTSTIREAYDGQTDIFDLYDRVNEKTRASNPKAILRVQTMDEALKEGKAEPIRKMLLGSLLREGDMCLMFGDEGTGKSVGVVQIGLAISKGLPLFGDGVNFKNECAPKKTLFFDFELENAELFQRYNESGHAYQFGEKRKNEKGEEYIASDMFRRVDMNPDNFDGSDESDILRTVQNTIEREQPEFIIIDNLTWLTSEAQDTAVAASFMKMFLRLRRKLGFTIIVVAHTPKRNNSEPLESKHMAGSSKLKDFAKNVIGISPSKQGDGIIYVKHLKMRNGEKVYTNQNVIQCSIEKNNGLLQWHFMGFNDETVHLATPTIEMSEDEICKEARKLRDEKGMTWEEILTEMSLPFSRTTLSRKVEKWELKNAVSLKNAAAFDELVKN
jgi:archaellum biogenesis ATPase FlaH